MSRGVTKDITRLLKKKDSLPSVVRDPILHKIICSDSLVSLTGSSLSHTQMTLFILPATCVLHCVPFEVSPSVPRKAETATLSSPWICSTN